MDRPVTLFQITKTRVISGGSHVKTMHYDRSVYDRSGWCDGEPVIPIDSTVSVEHHKIVRVVRDGNSGFFAADRETMLVLDLLHENALAEAVDKTRNVQLRLDKAQTEIDANAKFWAIPSWKRAWFAFKGWDSYKLEWLKKVKS